MNLELPAADLAALQEICQARLEGCRKNPWILGDKYGTEALERLRLAGLIKVLDPPSPTGAPGSVLPTLEGFASLPSGTDGSDFVEARADLLWKLHHEFCRERISKEKLFEQANDAMLLCALEDEGIRVQIVRDEAGKPRAFRVLDGIVHLSPAHTEPWLNRRDLWLLPGLHGYGACDFQNFMPGGYLIYPSAVFSDCAFRNCNFANQNLTGAVFSDCRFFECWFWGAVLEAAEFNRCRFVDTNLQARSFRGAKFDRPRFEGRTEIDLDRLQREGHYTKHAREESQPEGEGTSSDPKDDAGPGEPTPFPLVLTQSDSGDWTATFRGSGPMPLNSFYGASFNMLLEHPRARIHAIDLELARFPWANLDGAAVDLSPAEIQELLRNAGLPELAKSLTKLEALDHDGRGRVAAMARRCIFLHAPETLDAIGKIVDEGGSPPSRGAYFDDSEQLVDFVRATVVDSPEPSVPNEGRIKTIANRVTFGLNTIKRKLSQLDGANELLKGFEIREFSVFNPVQRVDDDADMAT